MAWQIVSRSLVAMNHLYEPCVTKLTIARNVKLQNSRPEVPKTRSDRPLDGISFTPRRLKQAA
jgi:hypothetical protein